MTDIDKLRRETRRLCTMQISHAGLRRAIWTLRAHAETLQAALDELQRAIEIANPYMQEIARSAPKGIDMGAWQDAEAAK